MTQTDTDDETIVGYGFLDATSGQQVRLRRRYSEDSEEYGVVEIPELSTDDHGAIFSVRGPEALQIVLEEEPFWLNADERRPQWGDYARKFDQLIPVKFRSTRSVTRDHAGRAVGLTMETNVELVEHKPLPRFLPKGEIMYDVLRKGAHNDFSPEERYLYMYPLTEHENLQKFVGHDVRLRGDRYEKRHVHRLKIMGDRIAAVLGAREPVVTFDPEVEEPAAPGMR